MSLARLDAGEVRRLILAGGEMALVDVREEKPFGTGHILTACNLPLSRLELRIGALVPRHATRIVLCDGGDGVAEHAAGVLGAAGYGNLALLDGGAPAWGAAGHELFTGVNVPSKAFGEVVELACHTPALDAVEVKRRLDAGDDLVILDSRPWGEYHAFNIPGGIDCPGAELAYRARDLAPDPSTTIVVNCAGRTRSIIGTQSLVNAGVPNPVFALRNGTIGWECAGLELEHGADRRYGEVSDAVRSWSLGQADALARRAGVRFIDRATLERWQAETGDRTFYVFDVRDPAEYAAGHLAGSRPAPGGQLVQATDEWVAVRDARIVLVDDTGVRARMTASWLRQLGYDEVAVLDGALEAGPLEQGAWRPTPLCETAALDTVTPAEVGATPSTILDLSKGLRYARAHPAGAFWALRSRLAEVAHRLPPEHRLVLCDDEDGALARLAAGDAALAGFETALMAGGLQAWRDAGLPIESGIAGALCELDDAWELPWRMQPDPFAAMRRYIDWELQLPQQIARDGLVTFRPLAHA